MLNTNHHSVFYSIHIRRITKYILWDMVCGSLLFIGFKNVQESTIVCFAASTLSVETVNQILKRTSLGRIVLKK